MQPAQGHRPQMVAVKGGELGGRENKKGRVARRDVVAGDEADGEAGRRVDLGSGE